MPPVNPTTQFHRTAEHLLELLRAAFKSPIFDVQMMPPVPSKLEWDRITRQRPFVGLAWAGLKPDKQARALKGASQWIVYLVVDNVGAVATRWTGDDLGIGLFGMVTAASFVLHGHTVPDVGSISITEMESLYREDWSDDATAIAAIGLEVDMIPGAAAPAGSTLEEFLTLTCAWVTPAPDGSVPMPTDTIPIGG